MHTVKNYTKPTYKIVGRYLSEIGKYLGQGKPITEALRGFPAYYLYCRNYKFPNEAELPWINHFAYKKLESLLKPDMNVLEFGSGGSTMFLKNKVKSIYSIEHDGEWFKEVVKNAGAHPGLTLNLHIPEKENNQDFPDLYKSVNGMYCDGFTFQNYAHAADHLPDGSIDLLIIDGRVRPACLIQTISKLKSGGILLFDNTERNSYQPFLEKYLKGWKSEKYQGVTVCHAFFSETSIYWKPSE
ncbi:hypothetical protein [Algoriphagus winogradskyi]|uniref:Class I SAM-dependent methyltransferase n=1 Tax=Algoriphagus winogradskyi TaxID=237017 RepID=A0ABY1NY31_9BACT|nr:hypothetical protein [Algoriphagus winogradskyi]SMP19903.1 hypothetical protein SAMN06265367_10349 [Algoriphagus winogradskyi]